MANSEGELDIDEMTWVTVLVNEYIGRLESKTPIHHGYFLKVLPNDNCRQEFLRLALKAVKTAEVPDLVNDKQLGAFGQTRKEN